MAETETTPAADPTTAEGWKARGNDLFKAGKWDDASEAYTRALDLSHPERHVLYSNRSAVNLKGGNLTAAVADANCAIDAEATYWKGYSRLGAALQAKGEWDGAEDAYKSGLSAVPASDRGHGELSKALHKCASRRPDGKNRTAPSASSSFAAGGTWKQVAFGIRIFILANAVLFLVPFSGGLSRSAWRYVLLGCIIKYALALSYHGRPAMNAEYGMRVVQDLSSHYLFLTFILFMGRPVAFALFPLVSPDAYILAGELPDGTLKTTLGKLAKPVCRMLYGTDDYRALQPAVLAFNAFAEIGLGVLGIMELLTPYRNVLTTLILWQFLRTRYMLGQDMRNAFQRLNASAHHYVGGVPVVGSVLKLVNRFAAWMVQMPKPGEQAARPSCVVM